MTLSLTQWPFNFRLRLDWLRHWEWSWHWHWHWQKEKKTTISTSLTYGTLKQDLNNDIFHFQFGALCGCLGTALGLAGSAVGDFFLNIFNYKGVGVTFFPLDSGNISQHFKIWTLIVKGVLTNSGFHKERFSLMDNNNEMKRNCGRQWGFRRSQLHNWGQWSDPGAEGCCK